MNVVSGNQEVVSKYFTDGKFNMDESASDFQEPKKKCIGPKTGKVVKAKPKTKRKPTKKIKGQKDIRVALKENDIVEYTKKFNNICRKSGIDVDSEQLQLAIALSESLADKDKETEASSSKELTATQQSGVIRKTLQQYGFKVQENVKSTGGRKKKYKKESKLLCTSEEQKKQIIADRYSEVLFQSLQTALIIEKNSELYGFSDKDTILNKACNVDYKTVKQTENFYIENLIEVHPNSIGSLLRDWSKIPGRPLSPTVTKVHDFQITNLEFTEKEIDVLLSGKLDLAQKVVVDKIKDMKPESKDCDHNTSIEELCSEETMKCTEDHLLHTEKDNGFDIKSKIGFVTSSNSEGAIIVSPEKTKIGKDMAKMTLLLPRCESPDLFDDDLTIDISNDVLPDSQTIEEASKAETVCEVTLDNVTKKKSNDFMDLTECVKNPNGYNKVVDESITLTQTADTRECTKRKSDDFMEITECVNYDPNETSKTENNATLLLKDTTGRNLEDFIEIKDCVTHATSKVTDIKDNIDLTQGSEENDETIIVDDVNETAQNMDNVNMDLTQSTNSDDSLPFVDIGGTRNKTIIITEEIEKVRSPSKDVYCDHANSKTNSINVERHSKSSKSSNVFDEFVYEHSHSSPEEKLTVDLTNESSNNVKHIDLTQSGESEEVAGTTIINVELQDNNQDIINDENNYNISTEVPYDDYIDIVNEHPIDFNHSKDDTVLYYDIESSNREVNTVEAKQSTPELSQKQTTESLSQNSEIFEISDEELNYSVHKSKHYSADNSQDIPTTQNFDFGGLSVLDNIGSLASFTKSRMSEPNTSTQGNDISLPVVNIRGTNVKTKSPNSTPTKTTIENAVQTPRNSDFIIKLDQVTPISDYASMTTPERNTELDKFGLKPLKRKRAIQILTHLYNQTHPLVEDTDIASPSKKQKPTTSPRKNTNDKEFKKKIDYDNPNKEMITNNDVTEFIEQVKITCKIDNIEEDFLKENRTVRTEDNPVVKDIEDCDEDDWVFQKREKSKVHTCRLPLHIAFHNYVSTSKNLRESILRYEPVNIEEIHKDLAAFGHRYHPKDLLKFLDKKCITVKTADNNGRNQNMKKTLKKS